MTTSGIRNENECQRIRMSGTTSDNEWYHKWQRVATNDNKWQRVAISAHFPFFQIKEEPTTKHSKENFLNLKEDLEEGLLN